MLPRLSEPPRRGARSAAALLLALAAAACAPRVQGPAEVAAPPAAAGMASEAIARAPLDAPTSVGTDAYGGPFDVLFNKGFAVAQWEDREREIFRHRYGWGAVAASLQRPGEAVARAGGWAEVLKVHALPFYQGGYREPQWVTNWFGHVLEGGLSYRRQGEWNQRRNVPLPWVTAAVTTYAAALVNEAYETPPPPEGEEVRGNAGIVMDLLVFDPLGILLFSLPEVRRLSHRAGMLLWPSQASLIVPSGRLENNGQSLIFKVPLPRTTHRLFVRSGMGVEGGLSLRGDDGRDLSVAVGIQSYTRVLDDRDLEHPSFGWSASLWLDRRDALLAGLTVAERTDRRFSLNVYPGSASVKGVTLGAWLVVDASRRPYVGVTGRSTLGAGIGLGF